jgi:hypothetical protein
MQGLKCVFIAIVSLSLGRIVCVAHFLSPGAGTSRCLQKGRSTKSIFSTHYLCCMPGKSRCKSEGDRSYAMWWRGTSIVRPPIRLPHCGMSKGKGSGEEEAAIILPVARWPVPWWHWLQQWQPPWRQRQGVADQIATVRHAAGSPSLPGRRGIIWPTWNGHIRSKKQDDNYGTSNIILPCPSS